MFPLPCSGLILSKSCFGLYWEEPLNYDSAHHTDSSQGILCSSGAPHRVTSSVCSLEKRDYRLSSYKRRYASGPYQFADAWDQQLFRTSDMPAASPPGNEEMRLLFGFERWPCGAVDPVFRHGHR
jgi:hypothetical protein